MTTDGGEIEIRAARTGDADAIAALHAASWRSAYRGILSDAYLDRDVVADRRAVWRARLGSQNGSLIVRAAGQEGDLLAFACLEPDHHPNWGTLIDNLHVVPTGRSRGWGGRVLAAAIDALSHWSASGPIHLTVYARNERARAVYDRWGGVMVDRFDETGPDGNVHDVMRCAWPEAARLRRRLVDRPGA